MEEHGVVPWAGESELPFVLSFTVPIFTWLPPNCQGSEPRDNGYVVPETNCLYTCVCMWACVHLLRGGSIRGHHRAGLWRTTAPCLCKIIDLVNIITLQMVGAWPVWLNG